MSIQCFPFPFAMAKGVVKLLEEFKREQKLYMKNLSEGVDRQSWKDIREIKNGMIFMNNSLEEIKLAFQSTVNNNVKLRGEFYHNKECEYSSRRLREDGCRITQREQYSRMYNLEIKGVPEGFGEMLIRNDIEICHRVHFVGSPNASNIVVQFFHLAKKNAVLQKARKKRNTL